MNGAEPSDINWLKIVAGLYRTLTRTHEVSSIVGFDLPKRWWGDYRIQPGQHTLWSGSRPKIPGVRKETDWKGKFDVPDPDSASAIQRGYHIVEASGKHDSVPGVLGEQIEELLTFGPTVGKVLLVVGVVATAVDLWEAYNQGDLGQEAVRQGFSWVGAIGGAEFGAAVGTAIFPGVGTIIGAIVFGTLGGLGGQYAADQLLATPLPRFIYYSTPLYGKNHMIPM